MFTFFLLNLGEWLALINVISPISLSLPYLTSLSLPLSFSSLQSDSCDRPASVWLMLLRCQMGERMAIMSNCAETCVCVHQRRPTSLHLITLNNSEHRYSVPVAVKETEPYPADLFSYLSLLFLSLCIVFCFFFPPTALQSAALNYQIKKNPQCFYMWEPFKVW